MASPFSRLSSHNSKRNFIQTTPRCGIRISTSGKNSKISRFYLQLVHNSTLSLPTLLIGMIILTSILQGLNLLKQSHGFSWSRKWRRLNAWSTFESKQTVTYGKRPSHLLLISDYGRRRRIDWHFCSTYGWKKRYVKDEGNSRKVLKLLIDFNR